MRVDPVIAAARALRDERLADDPLERADARLRLYRILGRLDGSPEARRDALEAVEFHAARMVRHRRDVDARLWWLR